MTQPWREIFEAADRALELEPEEQRAFVERFVTEQPEIGLELKAMIERADAASALETPASAFAAPLLREEGDEIAGDGAEAGSTFGPYRVRREVGWGGMGTVYLAERADDQYRKQVALKVMPRWTGGDRRRLQRFREERQILATLDHPGIARLLDGGVTDSGLPWFAMEYVDGQQIDKYCDAAHLTIEQRLTLFCDVCAAVQYAHRNLVVHRDLKPSNILVSADGRVALLDFGIAKLVAPDPSSLAESKTTGRLMTPLYASPEQIRGEPASTIADVYALGVLLYVLLTGKTPYRLANFDAVEIARAVLEQEPQRPSAVTEAKLARRLRGDLDAIVLKAMAKEPGRRYLTVERLETDVRRYLSGMPVLARPDSRSYLLQKFVRRHRAGVAAATVIVILILAFTTVMTVQRSRIRAQSARIAVERDRAEQVARFLLGTFQKVTAGDSGITAGQILDSAAARIERELRDHPEQRARLMFAMARSYHRLDMNDRAAALLEVSLSLRRRFTPRPDLDIAATLDLLGSARLAEGRVADAERYYREALALRRVTAGASDADLARTLVGLSAVLRQRRIFSDAERLSREAIAIDEARPDAESDLAGSRSALAHVMGDQGHYREASTLGQSALTLLRRSRPEEDPEVAAAIFDLAGFLHGAGNHGEADSLTRYGLALQRRLIATALLRGSAIRSFIPVAPGSYDVAGAVDSAFGGQLAKAPAATQTPASGDAQIVFVTDRDGPDPVGDRGNQEVYVMSVDGSNQRRLTHHKGLDSSPAFSPNGRQIAFTSSRTGGFDIFVMNANGTQQRAVTNLTRTGLGAVNSRWSPDGKRLVFHTRFTRIDIHVVNVDGTGLIRLTDDPGGATVPSWSPDGKRIAFASRRHGKPELYVMNADGTDQTRLTFNDAADARPEWSPDGRRIVFHSDRDGNHEIYVMNADGRDVVRLTTNTDEDGHPSWSPDGKRIVFHRRVLGHGQVHTMNADGSDVRRLTALSPVAFSGFATWNPASK